MKRTLIIMIALLTITGTAWAVGSMFFASGGGAYIIASGSVAFANIKINAANGHAFVDFNGSPDLSGYANGTNYIIVADSGGKTLEGYLKTAGDGEDVGGDLLAVWNLTNWTPITGDCVIDDADTFHTTAGSRGPYKNLLTQYALYMFIEQISTSSGSVTVMTYGPTNGAGWTPIGTLNTTHYGNSEQTGGNLYLRNTAISTTDITSMELYEVIGPAATGATIVSTSGGATYNFAVRTTGFTFYSNMTYQIWAGR